MQYKPLLRSNCHISRSQVGRNYKKSVIMLEIKGNLVTATRSCGKTLINKGISELVFQEGRYIIVSIYLQREW